MNGGKAALCVAVVLAALAAPAGAEEFWVKAGATGDGKSKASPAGRIEPFLADARRGDIIHVAKGEYNGRGDTGEFAVNVPNLTLVGGYSDDFAERDPFKHATILRRKEGVAANYTNTLGGIVGMNPDAHADGEYVSCSGLVLDGFVLDGSTRNVYGGPGPGLGQAGSWKEPLVKLVASAPLTSRDVKIRNCVLVNGYYQGIYVKWTGAESEVSNCLIVNCMIAGIDGTGAIVDQKGGGASSGPTKVTAKNNTIAFQWSHDKATMAHGIIVNKGRWEIENNVFSWLQGPQHQAVSLRGSDAAVKGNVLFLTGDAKAIAAGQKVAAETGGAGSGGGREGEEEESGHSGGAAAAPGAVSFEGNVNEDPDLKPEKGFFDCFSAYSVRYGKFKPDEADPIRSAWGLKPVEKAGASVSPELAAFGRPYPLDLAQMTDGFLAKKHAGKGFQPAGPFASYAPKEDKLEGASGGKADEYKEIAWEELKKPGLADGTKVKLKVGLHAPSTMWQLASRSVNELDYFAFEVRKTGNQTDNFAERMNCYAVRGAQPNGRWNQLGSKGHRKSTWKDGLAIRGVVYAAQGHKVPYALVVDFIGKP